MNTVQLQCTQCAKLLAVDPLPGSVPSGQVHTDGQVEEVTVGLLETVRLPGQLLQAAVVVRHRLEAGGRDEDDVGRVLGATQNLEGLEYRTCISWSHFRSFHRTYVQS